MQLTDQVAIRLSIGEWNQVLAMLGEGKYNAVAPLIAKIKEQGDAQLPALTGVSAGNGLDNQDAPSGA